MNLDYETQEGKLLIVAVGSWDGKRSSWVKLNPIIDNMGIPRERAHQIVSEWKVRGWAEIYWDGGIPHFIPKPEGQKMADVWRERLRPRTIKERIYNKPWGTLWAFVAAMAALIAAAPVIMSWFK